jgi:hypothetical protein
VDDLHEWRNILKKLRESEFRGSIQVIEV